MVDGLDSCGGGLVDVTIMNEKAILETDPTKLKGREADHLMGTEEQGQSTQLVNFPEIYQRSQLFEATLQEIDNENKEIRNRPNPVGSNRIKEYASTFPYQVWVLSTRTFIQMMRNPMITYVQLAQTLFVALLVGSIYFQIGDSQASIQDRVGALFFIMTNQAFSAIGALNVCE